MGVNRFRRVGVTLRCKSWIVVGHVKYPQIPTDAKTGAVLGARFAMQFAAMCGMSTLAVA